MGTGKNWKYFKKRKTICATQLFHANGFKINDIKIYLFVVRLKRNNDSNLILCRVFYGCQSIFTYIILYMYTLIFLAAPKSNLYGCNLNKYELNSRSIECYERKMKKSCAIELL